MNIRDIKNSWIFLTVVIASLYFITGEISFLFSLENSIVTICIFFAEGISLTAVIIFGKRAILGVFLGQLILALNGGLSFGSSVGISLVNSIELVIALVVLEKYNFDRRLLRIRDLNILFLTIIFVLQPFSSFFGNMVLLSSSVIESSNFFESLFSWWFGNLMGQLLIVPMLLSIYQNIRQIYISKTLLVVLLFITINYAFIVLLDIENIALLFSFMIPLVILISRHDGLYYAGISILVIAITSLYTSKIGVGIFTSGSITDNLININFYILAHIVIIYTHGISIVEKDIFAKKLEDLNSTLKETISSEVDKNRKKDRLMIQQSRHAQMGEAISMIAHQWRQPLNTISLLVEGLYLKYSMGKIDADTMSNFREGTRRQITQMSNTIDDFRNFFKPEKEKSVFLVDEIIERSLGISEHILKQSSIKVSKNLQKEVYISGYPNELTQVLINIINNAKDALIDRPIELERDIIIKLSIEDRRVSIAIEDNAGGIPNNIIDNIFNPYFSTKIEKNGTGLGLYMSKMIIEEHMQGSLDVKNIENGAKFILSFDAIV